MSAGQNLTMTPHLSSSLISRVWLRPLGCLYGAIVALRNLCFDFGIFRTYTSLLPVVSVGNLSAGGNGKTPLCLALAAELKQRGFEPVILMRGYKSRMKGTHQVSGSDSARQVGDEACLYLQAGYKVVLSARRVAGAKYIESNKFGNIIILDDGFQHRWLARNIDILTVDCSNREAQQSFIDARLLPEGLFREPKIRALRRAQALVFSTRRARELAQQEQELLSKGLPEHLGIFSSSLQLKSLKHYETGLELQSKDIVAFCGLAQPEGFFETLRDLGYRITARRVFSDHHPFTPEEIQNLRQDFPGLPLVCTTKDAVKLSTGQGDIYVLETSLKLPEALFEIILKNL